VNTIILPLSEKFKVRHGTGLDQENPCRLIVCDRRLGLVSLKNATWRADSDVEARPLSQGMLIACVGPVATQQLNTFRCRTPKRASVSELCDEVKCQIGNTASEDSKLQII